MDGEFRVRLKKYDSKKIIQAFGEYYVSDLAHVYARSAYNINAVVNLADFCAGYQTNDSLFLVYNREGNYLKLYVEPANKKDLTQMKELINRYFKGVTEMLDNKKIKWSKPQATITLEESPLTGHFKTKRETLWEIFENQREKMFLAPLGMVTATAATMYFNIVDKNDAGKDVGKAVTSGLEALFGFIVLVILKVLFTPGKRAFAFKI
jgi:hypothetical protein